VPRPKVRVLSQQETRAAILQLITVPNTVPEPSHVTPAEAVPAESQSPDRPLRPLEGMRIALLYKRGVADDGHVLELLERRLRSRGCIVFVDRHLEVGVEWAKEIERQIRTADAIIPLLSLASVQSEMLAYEVQIAHDAAHKRGTPRILPVRIGFTDPLPEPLSAILDPIHYALWQRPEDDSLVLEAIESALQSAALPSGQERGKLDAVGAALPLDSQFYVIRPVDAALTAALDRGDSIILIKGARQMGKTSLLARGLQHARQSGARVVLTDFQKLSGQHLESADALFLAIADSIAGQLGLEVDVAETWHPRRGPSENFERFWQRQVLRNVDGRIVWAMDEVDRLFVCHFASEVFGLFRSWHNERALDPDGPWNRLSLAIVYATEAHLFITDVNQSPFNVGTRLVLEDFTFDQLAALNHRSGSPLHGEGELARFARLVGGQPHLARRGMHEMAVNHLDLDRFEQQADQDDGIFGDHLRRILVLLARTPELTEAVRAVLRGEGNASPDMFYRLRSAGIMAGETPREMRPRCRLYETYLVRHLL
jgi:hypothetical protein